MGVGTFFSLIGMVPGSSPWSVVLSQTTFGEITERKGWIEAQSNQVTLGWETGQLVVSQVSHL